MKTLGIVGAGQMGRGIAQVAALAGLDVHLVDQQLLAASRAKAVIEFQLQRQVDKSKLMESDARRACARIIVTDKLSAMREVDIAIEAVPEERSLKERLIADLDHVVPSHAILASNTSSISITALAAASTRPERVIGLHFMNPVPVMTLVEIVRGLQTSEETYTKTLQLAAALGKTAVLAQDAPGFIVNRILIPMLNEAIFVLEAGLASKEDIDRAMNLGTNQPLGPLALSDLIGLDTVLAICECLHREFGDDKYRPAPLLRRYVAANWLGKKSGRGFYGYAPAESAPTH